MPARRSLAWTRSRRRARTLAAGTVAAAVDRRAPAVALP